MGRVFKRITVIILSFLFALYFSGCAFIGINGVKRFPDSHGSTYIYFDKVMLSITSPEDKKSGYWGDLEPDELYVSANEDGSLWGGPILKGPFEKAAFNQGELFILKEDKFYVFNVEEYHYQEGKYNEDIRKDIKEFTKEELDEIYPDNENYSWFDE